jgi:hypothetical protein
LVLESSGAQNGFVREGIGLPVADAELTLAVEAKREPTRAERVNETARLAAHGERANQRRNT